jgi:cytochrome oxidase assembly protein ShyY1
MIALGVWQLRRSTEKEALIASLEVNRRLPAMTLPPAAVADERILFRRATAFCLEVVGWRRVGGKSAAGQSGTRHIAECRAGAEGPGFLADMGVSADPKAASAWRGGEVSGTVVREPGDTSLFARLSGREAPSRPMLVSFRPAPGLQASVQPSPDSVTNNSLAYAFQWFFFAAVAAIIYWLAIRRRRRAPVEAPPAAP